MSKSISRTSKQLDNSEGKTSELSLLIFGLLADEIIELAMNSYISRKDSKDTVITEQ